MIRPAPHLLGFLLPVIVVWSATLGGAATFLALAYPFVLVPLVDAVAPRNMRNAAAGDRAALEASAGYRLVTWVWVPVQIALIGWLAASAARGQFAPLGLAGLIVSVGVTTGAIGITFAHELIHRPGAFERALGEVLLASVSYTHFAIEHVYGHHRHVATPRDPATARFGESVYTFYPRTVFGSLASALRIERDRLGRRGLPAWHPLNRFWRYGAEQALLYGAVWAAAGAGAAAAVAAQAVVAFSLLEVINYVEHYGLERARRADGSYERVSPRHSWDSSHRMSNWVLINLARHADHHARAARRYQALDHLDEAPQLPAGYGTMFLVALVPPLWRRVMDPRAARSTVRGS